MTMACSCFLSAALIISMALLPRPLLLSQPSLRGEEMGAQVRISKVGGEKERLAAVIQRGGSDSVPPPSAAATASARQVPTGPDPIHHNRTPIRRYP